MLEPLTRSTHRATVWLSTATLLLVAFLRADEPVDDRGSDSSEKAIMIALGVTLAGVVVAGATILITKLTGRF